MRDIFRGIICVVLLSLTLMAPSQELVVPFPQGEGYSLKKDAPSPETKWALKIVRPSGPLGASESIIVSPESFYYFYEAPGPPEEAAPGAVATPLPSFGERLKTDPIERYINPPVYEEGRLEGRAFFEAYGDVLKLA